MLTRCATRKRQPESARLDLVGCHGQTIYHQGEAASYLGKPIATTWQTGEGSVTASRLRVPVVSDFRPADMAAGGKGAPLVPFLDYALFRDARRGRIVQNIGGIGNLSAIPAGATPEDVLAFDTGPGNMLIDQLVQKLFDKPFDRNGSIAARGHVLEPVVGQLLRAPYFQQKPPKTAGREEYGEQYARAFLKLCGRADKADIIATATALTARSIVHCDKEICSTPRVIPRLHCFRRGHAKSHADADADRRDQCARPESEPDRRLRNPQPGQRSCSLCCARLSDMASSAR